MLETTNTIYMNTDIEYDEKKDIKTIKFDSSIFRYITIITLLVIILLLIIILSYC